MTREQYPDIFQSWFDRLTKSDRMNWENSNFSSTDTSLPAVNIRETANEFRLEVAAPGMKKEDFRLEYENGRLTICSDYQKNEQGGEVYTRREFSYQSFQRTFTLEEKVIDSEKIRAQYTDGILSVILPKREEVKPRPSREINVG